MLLELPDTGVETVTPTLAFNAFQIGLDKIGKPSEIKHDIEMLKIRSAIPEDDKGDQSLLPNFTASLQRPFSAKFQNCPIFSSVSDGFFGTDNGYISV